MSDMIDDSVFTTASSTATPLQVEKAKVAALTKQLSRTFEDKKQLQDILKRTEKDLEMSQHKTLQLQRAQIKSAKVANQKQQMSADDRDEVTKLKSELVSTQKDLVDEIESSKKMNLRIQSLQEKLAASKQQSGQGGGSGDKYLQMEMASMKNIVKQRDELLLVVRRQMKLIEVLRQQRLHVESAKGLCEVKCQECLDLVDVDKLVFLEVGTLLLSSLTDLPRYEVIIEQFYTFIHICNTF